MKLAQHILVPTDFSDASMAGVKLAGLVAMQNDAKVTLVHVYDPAPFAPIATRNVPGTVALGVNAEIERAIQDELAHLRTTKLRGVADVTPILVLGTNAADTICSYAEQQKVDLIVLSTHGRTGLARALIGSVAEKVVRYARCPVITVPARTAQKPATQ